MTSVRSKTDNQIRAFLFDRCTRVARVVVGGICALSLFVASQAPALAYSPDQIPRTVQASISAQNHAANQARAATSVSTIAAITAPSPSSPHSSAAPAGSIPIVAISPTLASIAGASAILSPAVIASPSTTAAIVAAPAISQFDGSVWAESDCGPTSLAMALGALGIKTDPLALRQLANTQMGLSDPDVGTSWDSLAAAARHFGLQTSPLYVNGNVRTWTVDEVKQQLTQGHPVLLLTHYRDLPNHPTSTYTGDHYVVALGVDTQGNIVYNDPASAPDEGFTHTMTPVQLEKAWTDTNFGLLRTAMAIYK